MKKALRSSLFLVLFVGVAAFAPSPTEYPSKVSEVLETYTPTAGASAAEIAEVFLDSLSAAHRAECAQSLDSPNRLKWTNTPPGADEDGVRLGDLDEKALQKACDLLATVLSPQGYGKVRDILLADDKLLRNGRPRRGFGAENYWLGIFGTPAKDGEWGLQLDGHHIAVNLSFAGKAMTMSPSFIGTQPAKYTRGGETIVPLESLAARAFAVMEALDDEQREQAKVYHRRGRIAAGAGRDGVVPKREGLPCAELNAEQKEVVVALLRAYVDDLPKPHAEQRLAELKTEIPKMHFSWKGPIENPADVSYRLQGPTVLIEYACQDLGGDPLDHLHSIYRNPENEYGIGFPR